MATVLRPVIPELGALARSRPGTLSLAQGMVSWGPPPVALAALQQGAASGCCPDRDRYGSVEGDPELLAAIADHLHRRHGVELEQSTLLATAGSNMAFNALAQVLCAGPPQPPSELILPLPYYFNHVMAIQLAGGVPVLVDAGLVPDPQRLEQAITPRTRAIVTISPNNPSGVVMPPATLAAINALCARHGLLHISDEAYAEFVYGATPHCSPGSLPGSSGHTVTIQSLSKAYGMAGWRLGYMAVPQALAQALAQVQDTVLICPPRLLQRAALAALQAGPSWCAPQIAALEPRRRLLLQAVAQQGRAGLPLRLLAEPDGAFYALLQLEAAAAPGLSGDALMRRLVLEHGVAALCGESFGLDPAGAGGPVLRLSYGLLELPQLEEALQRLFCGIKALLASGAPG
jgi:aspartate/methionine/tyrosine aminotransferase